MGKYFGTDGFRGEAGITLTADHAYKVGRFLGWYYNALRERNGDSNPARIVIGKDTRRSSYMFEYSLVAGLTASWADAYLLHVTTTPSVAYIARVDDFDCGIMISASHNPYYDNGIKLIDCYGEKMPEETLLLVEDYIDGKLHAFDKDWAELPFAHREHIGCTVDYVAGRNRYMGYLISLGVYSFRGVKVGLDCANGSSWNIAKSVFDALGEILMSSIISQMARTSTPMQVQPISRAFRSLLWRRAWMSVLPTMVMLTAACALMKRGMSSLAIISCTSMAAI